jgi:hypothetical protein
MRIRLTRSIFLDGEHAEEGSIHEIAKPLARDLILQGSAVPLRILRWVLGAYLALGVGVGAVLWWGMARGWW